MADLTAPFAPDWVSPPGESILDIAEERGWSQAELAQRLGYTEHQLSRLIHGEVPVSSDAAGRLAPVLVGQPHDSRRTRCGALVQTQVGSMITANFMEMTHV